MKEKFLGWVLLVVFLSPLIVAGLWLTATLSACGWKGLFVECRIVAECKP